MIVASVSKEWTLSIKISVFAGTGFTRHRSSIEDCMEQRVNLGCRKEDFPFDFKSLLLTDKESKTDKMPTSGHVDSWKELVHEPDVFIA